MDNSANGKDVFTVSVQMEKEETFPTVFRKRNCPIWLPEVLVKCSGPEFSSENVSCTRFE